MTDMPLGALNLVDGWLTDPRWYLAAEGPYTSLAKLCIVNVMTVRDLCAALGARLLTSQATPVHGRSLLDMSWARGARGGSGALAADMRARCLALLTDRWWRVLASDKRLRFCPSCVAQGFQSALCQLDALTHCPLHGDAIVDICAACGAATPRYALDEGFECPMTCRQCGQPYAPCWGPSNPIGHWHGPADTRAYERLAQWLRETDAIRCVWPDQGAWMVDRTDERSAAEKRVFMFGLLARLCPSAPVAVAASPEVRLFGLPTMEPGAWAPADVSRDETEATRRQIYKSIRRHYRTELGAIRRRVWEVRDDLIWDTPHTVVMPASTRVSAGVHAFLCWRSRFEQTLLLGEITTRRDAVLRMRLETLFWPLNWYSCDRAWGHFVQLCLAQELSAAQELHEELRNVDLHRPTDLSAWMVAVNRACHRFGPARQAWPAKVSCLLLEPSTSTPARQLALVWARPNEQAVRCESGSKHDCAR